MASKVLEKMTFKRITLYTTTYTEQSLRIIIIILLVSILFVLFCIFLLFCSPVSDPTKTVRYASACSNPSKPHDESPEQPFFDARPERQRGHHIIIATKTAREKSHARFHGDLSPD